MEGMIAGALASGASTCILYPLEKIRIEMQTSSQSESVLQTIKRIKTTQGWLAFYKGLKAYITGQCLSYALYFLFYEKLKKIYKQHSFGNTIKITAVAWALGCLFVNPFWVLQTTSALSKTRETMLQAAMKLIQTDGVLAFWKGLSSSLILVSSPIIQFCIYEWFKVRLPEKSGFMRDLQIFLIAAISKLVSTILTYPYSVIRTHQHISKSSKKMTQVIRQLYYEGGFLRFFKGMSPKLIQTVLNSAIMLTLYQRFTKLFLSLLRLLKKRTSSSKS